MCGCGNSNPTVVYVDLSEILIRLTRMEALMTTANDKLVEVQTALADVSADVLAKLEQLENQLGDLPADAQATLDQVKASVQALDTVVGDADGSDTPPVEPTPEPSA